MNITNEYYEKINTMIINSKTNIYKNINHEMVKLYYNIGMYLNELIEKYHLESSQNKIIKEYSEKFTKDYGKGFDESNLKKMKKFYSIYKGGATVWHHLKYNKRDTI